MNNRAGKKLLSVVLAVAVCISTLCSSMLVASAATTDGTYSVVTDSVAAGAKKTTVTVTITNPNGLTNGTFDLMFGKEVIDGVNFDANGNYVTPQNETYDEFMARDTDGNFMISAINFYKQVTEQVPVYDEEGNIVRYDTVTKTVVDTEKSYKENTGNKGVLLPNVYDDKNGLYDTKIEITGGTKLGGGSFDLKDFANDNYDTFAKGENNTTNAVYKKDTTEGADKNLVIDDDNDGRKYIYNMTDGYKLTHLNSTPITYVDVVENGETVKRAVPNKNLLEKYYREYTTVDVATENLGYKISTVSEDTVGSSHGCAQYAQGFKDITFNSSVAYESITFTVTFDFTGTSDRISANSAVTLEEITGTTTDAEGKTVSYRDNDGHWATENYVQYGYKYALNFMTADSVLAGLSAVAENNNTNFFHTHEGTIDKKEGTVAPVNQAAIDELLKKNPNAKAGVDYFEIYNATCDICKRVTPSIAASNLPYNAKGAYKYNNYRNISGITMVYEDDGSLSLNIHYPSTMVGEQIFITDQNGMVMEYSDILENNNDTTSKYQSTASSYASVKDEETSIFEGDILSTSKMISVKGFSSADLDKTLYIARYTPKSDKETQLMGITHTVSLADYLNEVIAGEYEDQDKLLALALLNYGNSSKTALTTPNDYKPYDEVDVWEGRTELRIKYDQAGNKNKDQADSANWVLKVDGDGAPHRTWGCIDADLAGSGTKEDPYIIANAEQLFYIVKIAGKTTAGKYYKVKDGIKEFRLNPNVTADMPFEEAMANITKSGSNWDCAAPFQGHFDGNGVIISGIRTTANHSYAGLFPRIKGEVTVKNVTICNSLLLGKTATGAVAGQHDVTANAVHDITIENVSVYNCQIESTSGSNGAGALIGYVGNAYKDENDKWHNGNTYIKNCYVNLDENYFNSKCETDASSKSSHGGLVGYHNSSAMFADRCVVIGIRPYTARYLLGDKYTGNTGWQGAKASNFTNIYTDHACDDGYNNASTIAAAKQDYTGRIFTLTTDKMTGKNAKANMPNLDWSATWYTNEGNYPALYNPYNLPKAEKTTIYWDGTIATGIATGDGSKTNPYVIKTAAEFAWLIQQKESVSADKYFEIDETIGTIVLQPEDKADAILALANASAVKTYFESASGLKSWPNVGWEGSAFCGHFDGNGVTIYGLYQKSSNNAGLFSTVDAGSVIENIALKNSYLTSTATDYQVGGIAAVANGDNYGRKNSGIIWINGCTVANNYMYNPATKSYGDRSGVIFGAASNDSVYIDNCLVYGNDATYIGGKMPLCSSSKNSIAVNSNALIPEGLVTVNDGTSTPLYYNMIRNCVILGNLPYDLSQGLGARFNDPRCYQNVYTDAQTGVIKEMSQTNNGVVSYFTTNDSQIKQISAEEILGNAAKNAMPTLDWYDASANPNGKWYSSKLAAMPSLNPLNEEILQNVGTVVPGVTEIYNAIIFDDPDTRENNEVYHNNGSMTFGVYQTALSLKAEPYMSFAFAFYGDYQTNRDKIQIRFSYTANGVTTTTDAITPPAYTGEEIKNVDGWTNTKANGRYHTYRATNLPIEAMLNGITVEMNYNGEGWKNYGTFDIEGIGYQFEQLNASSPSEYYETRIEAAKALVLYIKARAVCFGA